MFRLPEFINDVAVQVFLSEKHENREIGGERKAREVVISP